MKENAENTDKAGESIQEIQLISFRLAGEEFGVEIENVKEILKMSDITPVPRSPGYLLGMMNLRGTIIPVMDLKKRMNQGFTAYTEKTRVLVLNVAEDLSGIVVDEVLEVQQIDTASIEPPPQVTRGIDKFYLKGVAKLRNKNRLIMTLNLAEILNVEISKKRKSFTESTHSGDTREETKKKIEEELVVIFNLGKEEFGLTIAGVKEILKVGVITTVPNVPDYVKGIQNVRGTVIPIIDMRRLVGMESLAEDPGKDVVREKRILIVEIAHTTVGILVDRVNEISRILKELIDITPAVISSYGKEIKGVAKLNSGARLIMIVDENLLLSSEEITTISRIQEEQTVEVKEETKAAEKQYVIFSVGDEEFGLTIDKVQEIFKPDQITLLPKAPKFIKGMTNLRGNIIPVVDVKERFGVSNEKANIDETANGDAKILVVMFKETIAGLLVDNVREVLRISEDVIEDAPTLVLSNTDFGYLEGIAKINNGERIILLLNIDDIMSKKEFAKLQEIKQSVEDKKGDQKKKE